MSTLAHIPESTWRDYLRLAEATVARFKRHEHWDDLWGAVQLEVCRALSRLPQDKAGCAWGLIKKVAREAVLHWLRSPENPARAFTRTGAPLPVLLSFEGLGSSMEFAAPYPSLTVPDFAPALIHRLWCREVMADAFALMSPAQRLRVARYLAGEPIAEEGEAGRQAQALFAGALNRYLKSMGLPTRPYGRETLQTRRDPEADKAQRARWARDRYHRQKQADRERR